MKIFEIEKKYDIKFTGIGYATKQYFIKKSGDFDEKELVENIKNDLDINRDFKIKVN